MPLRDDLLNPIAGENPSGANLRYDPLYDKIKEARREDDDAPQGEWAFERKVADWKQVVKLAGDALAARSKDLQLAAWLTEAMLRTEGFAGLLAGLKFCQGLIENFWDTLYPELEDGDAEFRAAPLDWIGSRFDQAVRMVPVTRKGYDWFQYKQSRAVGYEADTAGNETKLEARTQAIADGKVTAEEFDTAFAATPKVFYAESKQNLDDCLAAIESLSGVCEPKFGDATPGFGSLRTALEEVRSAVNGLLQKKRELEPDEEPEAGAEAAGAEPGEAETAETAEGSAVPGRARKTVSAEPADRDDAFSRVAAVAKYLRREDPYSPAPYLMLRGLRWGELRAGGESPSLELLAPPATQVRQDLKRLSVEGNWVELIELAENTMAMPCGRAWLDLQRYAVKALDEYGYPAIASAIRSELRSLVADLPQLPQWTLADDTPTANSETQAWLKDVTAPQQAVNGFQALPSMGAPAESAPGEPAPRDAFQVAMESARSGDVQQAIEILSHEIAHERSGRARFQRKIQLAQICMSTGHEAIAYPILNDVSDEIEHRRLEEWEASEVVAHPLALLFRCMNQLDGDAESKRKLYARICRLDPVQALACSK